MLFWKCSIRYVYKSCLWLRGIHSNTVCSIHKAKKKPFSILLPFLQSGSFLKRKRGKLFLLDRPIPANTQIVDFSRPRCCTCCSSRPVLCGCREERRTVISGWCEGGVCRRGGCTTPGMELFPRPIYPNTFIGAERNGLSPIFTRPQHIVSLSYLSAFLLAGDCDLSFQEVWRSEKCLVCFASDDPVPNLPPPVNTFTHQFCRLSCPSLICQLICLVTSMVVWSFFSHSLSPSLEFCPFRYLLYNTHKSMQKNVKNESEK